MSTRRRRAGVVGAAVVGVTAAGVAAGIATEKAVVGRARVESDPMGGEPYGLLPADKELTVEADDGIPLHVEVVGRRAGAPTVIFVHGFCLDMGTWHFQRRGLTGLADPKIRMVFFDQRGHGRSGWGDPENATIDQLGQDLSAVIDAVAPLGSLVLCGHSMGGMAIMALAEQQPDLFAKRVAGVALISTSGGDMDTVSFGLPKLIGVVRKPLIPLLTTGMRSRSRLLELARRTGGDVIWLATRRWAFGTRQVSSSLVDYIEKMNSSTPVSTIAAFLATLNDHRRYDALDAFQGIETLVMGGAKDLMTPVDHSRRLAEAMPNARFLEVSGGAHLMLMDHAEEVNVELREFFARAVRTAPKTLRLLKRRQK